MKKPVQIDINLQQKNTKTKDETLKKTSDNETELSNKMIKDHRTEHETKDIESVFEGDLDQFLNAYLESTMKNEQRD